MPPVKKQSEAEANRELLAALRDLEANRMAEMAALNAAPAPAAGMYAPLVTAVRASGRRFVPKNAKEAEDYGRQWQQARTQEALEDYSYLPEGGRKPEYLEELKRRGAIQAAGGPTAQRRGQYKLAPEMVIQGSNPMDVDLDDTTSRPRQYFPTREYPGTTGTYREPDANLLWEPVPRSEAEKQQLIDDELRIKKWNARKLKEFETPEDRIVTSL